MTAEGRAHLPSEVPVTQTDVETAAARLVGKIRQTPVWSVDPSEFNLEYPPRLLTLKLEQLQHSGTFKARGATNFLLSQPISSAGVVAASGGNHGAAVAWAAQQHGHVANIFVPTIAAPAKIERLHSYGARVHQVGSVFAEAYAASEMFRAESGATPIHAYNDPTVMAGAGTTGLEFRRQVAELQMKPLDSVLIACGGGGLSGGIAAAIGDSTRIGVCETEGTPTFASARQSGQPVEVEISGLGADALGASMLGSNTWAMLHSVDARSYLVDDQQLSAAQDLLWSRFRLRVEPSAATPLAVLLSGAYQADPEEHLGIVVCGANVAD